MTIYFSNTVTRVKVLHRDPTLFLSLSLVHARVTSSTKSGASARGSNRAESDARYSLAFVFDAGGRSLARNLSVWRVESVDMQIASVQFGTARSTIRDLYGRFGATYRRRRDFIV